MSESNAYRGSQRLKRVNVPVSYDEEQIREFEKCALDPIYFIRNYIQIINVDLGLIPFNLYPYQEEMVDIVTNNRFSIFKLPRQSGKSTLLASILVWYILFHENYSVLVLAHKGDNAKDIMQRVKLAYENVPQWMQQGIVKWDVLSVFVENGSKIVASTTTESSGRGGSYNLVYLDEFAFVENNIQDEFFASTYPTISSGRTTKFVITSTPNGMNKFYNLWVESEKGKNSFVPFSIQWNDVPGRDDKWREEQIKNMGAEKFRTEFNTEFIGSSNTLIDPTVLQRLMADDPIVETETTRQFEKPKPGHLYMCMVDVAEGINRDSSTFVIVDVTELPYKVVASFRDPLIPPMMLANPIFNFCRQYNDAYVLIEINRYGSQTAQTLYHEFEYENVIFCRTKGAAGQIPSSGFGGSSSYPGVKMSERIKRIGCQNIKTLIETYKIVLSDKRIIDELYTFVQDGESYNAEQGHHDDLVIPLVLLGWLSTQEYYKQLTNVDVRYRIAAEREALLDQDLMPFGFSSNDYYNPPIEQDPEDIPTFYTDSDFERWMRS